MKTVYLFRQSFLLEAIPAVRYIFRAEPRHKRMPLPSGLKIKVSKTSGFSTILKT